MPLYASTLGCGPEPLRHAPWHSTTRPCHLITQCNSVRLGHYALCRGSSRSSSCITGLNGLRPFYGVFCHSRVGPLPERGCLLMPQCQPSVAAPEVLQLPCPPSPSVGKMGDHKAPDTCNFQKPSNNFKDLMDRKKVIILLSLESFLFQIHSCAHLPLAALRRQLSSLPSHQSV